jgi:murein DD-endopeptidase MepM/ murein hydrolase activator NlpD
MKDHKKKQLKLLYYAHNGTDLQEINLGWKRILILVVTCMSVLLLLVSFVLGFFSQLSQNWQVMSLARAHQKLSNVINDMYTRMDNIEGLIEHVEKQDSSLNLFADTPVPTPLTLSFSRTLKSLAFGSSKVLLTDQIDASQEKKLVDDLNERMQKASACRQEMKENFDAKIQQLKQTPSIRPLWGGRLTDKYGYRLDPLVDRVMYHTGIDFSAPRGTEVYASADGKVKEVVTRYRSNNDYGRFVLVDHGYGRQTRYAHLETITVRLGQLIARHTVIGRVGDSGRSTGPHLHYEVLENGKTVDPAGFILN